MYHIDTSVCRSVLTTILTAPDAKKEKVYYLPTTKLSGGPCHVELKKSHSTYVIALKLEEVALAIGAILDHCDKDQGAGWAQLLPEHPWYVLIYGDPRMRLIRPSEPPKPLNQGR